MRNWFYLGGRLLLITLIAGLALAFTYQMTSPVKQAREAEELKAALESVFPGTQTEEIDLSDHAEDEAFSGIVSAYRATGEESGYVFVSAAKGYKSTIQLTVGIKDDGTVTGMVINSHDESPGIGDRIMGAEFQAQFAGAALPVEYGNGVDALSGATYSSKGVKNALNQAYDAMRILGEAK